MVKIFKKSIRLLFKVKDKFAANRILVLGDSHAKVFNNPLFQIFFPTYAFDVCSVKGATASGLSNPNSKTQAFEIFNKELKNLKDHSKVIILLGEVDTGFVIWYRSEKYNKSLSTMFEGAIANYTNFIYQTNKSKGCIVVSTPLPTISDQNDWGEIANLRKTINASQVDRTSLTLKFNSRIETFCRENKIKYLNLDKQSLGKTGLVKEFLLNKNPNNHHYSDYAYARLLIRNLNKTILKKSHR